MQFWSARPEVHCIWVSVYTPQIGEKSPETLTPEHRVELARQLPALAKQYRKLLFHEGMARAIISPPKEPCRLRVLENVGQLFGRSREPRRTMRLRRDSRLFAVRLRHQHRLALGQVR